MKILIDQQYKKVLEEFYLYNGDINLSKYYLSDNYRGRTDINYVFRNEIYYGVCRK